MRLTAKEVAKRLGISEPRVSQLRKAGRITDMSPEGIERLRVERDKRKDFVAKREAHYREVLSRWDDLLTRVDTLNARLTALVIAAGAGAITREDASRIGQGR